MERITITDNNYEDIRESIGVIDQRGELEIGCVTWGLIYQPGSQRGQVTIWPNGRGAIICLGGDSIWGNVTGNDDDQLVPDDDPDHRIDLNTGERLHPNCMPVECMSCHTAMTMDCDNDVQRREAAGPLWECDACKSRL